MLRRVRRISVRSQRGQSAAESMGVLLLVAVIIGALIASGLPDRIAGATGDMIDKISGGQETAGQTGGGNGPGGGGNGGPGGGGNGPGGGGNGPGGDGDGDDERGDGGRPDWPGRDQDGGTDWGDDDDWPGRGDGGRGGWNDDQDGGTDRPWD